jgi:hypothetical protein
MGRACSWNGVKRNVCTILVGKPETETTGKTQR